MSFILRQIGGAGGGNPLVVAVSQPLLAIGMEVQVTIAGFQAAPNSVTIGGTPQTVVGSPSTGSITFQTVAGTVDGILEVSNSGEVAATSSNVEFSLLPIITDMAPNPANLPALITITGFNLSGTEANNVLIDGVDTGVAPTLISDNEVKWQMPISAQPGGIVTLQNATGSNDSLVPLLGSFVSATFQDIPQLIGTGFGETEIPTFSNNDLTVSTGSNGRRAMLTNSFIRSADTEVYYWEITFDSSDFGFGRVGVGCLTGPEAFDVSEGFDSNSHIGGYRSRSATTPFGDFQSSGQTSTSSANISGTNVTTANGFFNQGDTVGMVLDMGAETFEMYDASGVSLGSVTFAQMNIPKSTHDFYCAGVIGVQNIANGTYTINTGASPFVHPVPAGATPGLPKGSISFPVVSSVSPDPISLPGTLTITGEFLTGIDANPVTIGGSSSGISNINVVSDTEATIDLDASVSPGFIIVENELGTSLPFPVLIDIPGAANRVRITLEDNFSGTRFGTTELAAYNSIGATSSLLVGGTVVPPIPGSLTSGFPFEEAINGVTATADGWISDTPPFPVVVEIDLQFPDLVEEVGVRGYPSDPDNSQSIRVFSIELSSDGGATYGAPEQFTVASQDDYDGNVELRFALA